MEAAKQLKEKHHIGGEGRKLRTLNHLDINTIVVSVQKTGRCLIADEAPRTQGFGAETASQITELCFLNLEAPVMRCCGLDTPFPNALEKEHLPDAYRIVDSVLKLVEY